MEKEKYNQRKRLITGTNSLGPPLHAMAQQRAAAPITRLCLGGKRLTVCLCHIQGCTLRLTALLFLAAEPGDSVTWNASFP